MLKHRSQNEQLSDNDRDNRVDHFARGLMNRRNVLLGALALSVSACTNLRSVRVPMHSIYDRLDPAANAKSLIILMPGVYDHAKDFERYGFQQAARELSLNVDMVAVDSNLKYLQRGMLIQRLQEDVVAPARQQGYTHIWMVGISLGGLAAMLYASRHTDINGIVAIAPFLGRPEAVAEIDNAGGVDQWQPAADSQMLDWERDLYIWLKDHLQAVNSPSSPESFRLIMGLGMQDRFYAEQSALAKLMPSDNVFATPGKHVWPVWQVLWRDILKAHGDRFAGDVTNE